MEGEVFLENNAKLRSAGKVTAGSLRVVALSAQLPGLLFWKQHSDFPSAPAAQVGLPSPSCRERAGPGGTSRLVPAPPHLSDWSGMDQ